MPTDLQLLADMDPKQREFFDMLQDPTHPNWMDVRECAKAVWNSELAGEVLMSAPVGRAWRNTYLIRDRGGMATMLLRIASGESSRKERRFKWRYDKEGQKRLTSEELVIRQPSLTESMKAMKMLREYGMAGPDNLAERVTVRPWTDEELLE